MASAKVDSAYQLQGESFRLLLICYSNSVGWGWRLLGSYNGACAGGDFAKHAEDNISLQAPNQLQVVRKNRKLYEVLAEVRSGDTACARADRWCLLPIAAVNLQFDHLVACTGWNSAIDCAQEEDSCDSSWRVSLGGPRCTRQEQHSFGHEEKGLAQTCHL